MGVPIFRPLPLLALCLEPPTRQSAGAGGRVALRAGPALRVAAWPLSHRVEARGLDSLDQRSAVLASDGSRMAVLHNGVNREVVPLAHIPEVVRRAVLAAEDQDFWDHGGYDGRAILRALLANVRAGEVTQGGSTVTQQVAKQNFVGNQQSVLRKAKELLYSVALEERLSKDDILERYLNQVYFGAQAYGVAAAAEEFFGIQVADLSVAQAALLAGLIRAPSTLDPRRAPEALQRACRGTAGRRRAARRGRRTRRATRPARASRASRDRRRTP